MLNFIHILFTTIDIVNFRCNNFTNINRNLNERVWDDPQRKSISANRRVLPLYVKMIKYPQGLAIEVSKQREKMNVCLNIAPDMSTLDRIYKKRLSDDLNKSLRFLNKNNLTQRSDFVEIMRQNVMSKKRCEPT